VTAVEGIVTSRSVTGRFASFDEMGRSAEERRSILQEEYGKRKK